MPRADRDREKPTRNADVVFGSKPSCSFNLVRTRQAKDGHTFAWLVNERPGGGEIPGFAHTGEECDVVCEARIVEQDPVWGALGPGLCTNATQVSPSA